MNSPKVLIVSASPDALNHNSFLRSCVVDGFVELLGQEWVSDCQYEDSVGKVTLFKPTLIIIFGSCMPDEVDYFPIKAAADKIGAKICFWLHDDPYEFDEHYKLKGIADFIISNDRWAALHYDGRPSFHLPMAASKKHHYRELLPTTEKTLDVFFCGVAFSNRIALIKDLKRSLNPINALILGDQWPIHELPFAKNSRISTSEMCDHYQKSKFTLNIGRNYNLSNKRYLLDASTPGPRTFEASMAGATQLYFVESLEIEEYFKPDKEIVLFNSVKEFDQIIEKFNDSPSLFLSIGKAAQDRALAEHTYRHRAEKLLMFAGWGNHSA